MDHIENGSNRPEGHVIAITRESTTSTSVSRGHSDNDPDSTFRESTLSSSSQASLSQSPSTSSSSVNISFSRRGENRGRRNRSPLNSGFWISIELFFNVSQIISAIIVLCLSRHEKPHTPLFAWVIGYTVGCAASLPHLYWRYTRRNNHRAEQESSHAQSNNNTQATYTSISVTRSQEAYQRQESGTRNRRLNSLIDHTNMALDCFFAIWFVVGNVWIFGGRSSASVAPNMYRLSIVFLAFSCIGYAMPFILCTTICCCLPCIISVLGLQEDINQNKGATAELIDALPTIKFKSKTIRNMEDCEIGADGLGDGGVVAAGTDKERVISGEDAVCCICLANYVDNDVLRELTCSHFFHVECVDKWLKINALCPLCKAKVGEQTCSSSCRE